MAKPYPGNLSTAESLSPSFSTGTYYFPKIKYLSCDNYKNVPYLTLQHDAEETKCSTNTVKFFWRCPSQQNQKLSHSAAPETISAPGFKNGLIFC